MSQKKVELRIAEKLGVSEAKANTFLNTCIDAIKDELNELGPGDNLVIRNFGTYRCVHQAARMGRNPATGAAVPVAAKNVLKFKPAKQMQEVVRS